MDIRARDDVLIGWHLRVGKTGDGVERRSVPRFFSSPSSVSNFGLTSRAGTFFRLASADCSSKVAIKKRFLSRSYTFFSIYWYIRCSARKLVSRKTPYSTSRTQPVTRLGHMFEESLNSQQYFWDHCQIPSTHSSTPTNASETIAVIFSPPSIGQLENRTSSRATDV